MKQFPMSRRMTAQIRGVRVHRLADGSIGAQRREIEEMDRMTEGIGENGPAGGDAMAAQRHVPKF